MEKHMITLNNEDCLETLKRIEDNTLMWLLVNRYTGETS